MFLSGCLNSTKISKIVYNEKNDEGYIFEDDVQYAEKLHELHNDLPFLCERMKTEKVEKFVSSLHNKTEYVIHVRNLQQTLNHGLVLKKVQRVIKFNHNAWLNSHIDMNTYLRKKQRSFISNKILKKLCYIDSDSFIVYIKTDDIAEDIEEDVETRFDTLNYELDRPLPKERNKKSNWIIES